MAQPHTAPPHHGASHDPLAPHAHEPNPRPPNDDPTILVMSPYAAEPQQFSVTRLQELPVHSATNCFIVSTGHGTSGPFHFQGPLLSTLAAASGVTAFSRVAVISGDGFGTRLTSHEVSATTPQTPVLLALMLDGVPLTRHQGLVRLIVPAETDDALKQVKWVSRIQFEL